MLSTSRGRTFFARQLATCRNPAAFHIQRRRRLTGFFVFNYSPNRRNTAVEREHFCTFDGKNPIKTLAVCIRCNSTRLSIFHKLFRRRTTFRRIVLFKFKCIVTEREPYRIISYPNQRWRHRKLLLSEIFWKLLYVKKIKNDLVFSLQNRDRVNIEIKKYSFYEVGRRLRHIDRSKLTIHGCARTRNFFKDFQSCSAYSRYVFEPYQACTPDLSSFPVRSSHFFTRIH